MAGDELVRGVAVPMLEIPLRQHVFLLRLQHRKTPDFLKIMRQASVSGLEDWYVALGHSGPSWPPCAARLSRAWANFRVIHIIAPILRLRKERLVPKRLV